MAADLLNQGLSEAELEKAEYSVMDLQEIAQEVESFNQSFALLLGGIASISLLVGGIGVMNIMLVSVTERTREIGIKKALGAKRRVILFQFLTEAVVLTSIGGILGVLAGFGIAKLLTVVFRCLLSSPFRLLSEHSSFQWQSALFSACFRPSRHLSFSL